MRTTCSIFRTLSSSKLFLLGRQKVAARRVAAAAASISLSSAWLLLSGLCVQRLQRLQKCASLVLAGPSLPSVASVCYTPAPRKASDLANQRLLQQIGRIVHAATEIQTETRLFSNRRRPRAASRTLLLHRTDSWIAQDLGRRDRCAFVRSCVALTSSSSAKSSAFLCVKIPGAEMGLRSKSFQVAWRIIAWQRSNKPREGRRLQLL